MNLDASLVRWLNEVGRTGVLRPVTVWASSNLAMVLAATLVVGGVYLAARDLHETRQLRFRLIEGALVALLALGLGMLVNQFIGAAWFRARPYDVVSGVQLLAAPSADPSFPSDHATAAFCLAIGIGVASSTLRTILVVEAVLLVVARVAVGLHYPTDIFAGFLVAIASVAIARDVVVASSPLFARTAGKLVPLNMETSVDRRHLHWPGRP